MMVLERAAAVVRQEGRYIPADQHQATGVVTAQSVDVYGDHDPYHPVCEDDRIEVAAIAAWMRDGAPGADRSYAARVQPLLDRDLLTYDEAALLASAIGAGRRVRAQVSPPRLWGSDETAHTHQPPMPPPPPPQSLRQAAAPVWAWTVPLCVIPTILIWVPAVYALTGSPGATAFGAVLFSVMAALVGLGIGAVIGGIRNRRAAADCRAHAMPLSSFGSAPTQTMSPGELRRDMWWAAGGPS